MRAASYIIALVLLVTGSSLAGAARQDLPAVGTFSYNGSPVVTPAPAVMAAAETRH